MGRTRRGLGRWDVEEERTDALRAAEDSGAAAGLADPPGGDERGTKPLIKASDIRRQPRGRRVEDSEKPESSREINVALSSAV